MSDCGVCIGSEADDICEIYRVRIVKARKQHTCAECGKTIEIGEKYENHFSVYEGDATQIKTCVICSEIRDAFMDDSSCICPGDLWSEMESAFPELTTSCFDRLKTPEAKSELRRRWMEWKGLI